ncbi:hypothetical protein [Burkholderia ubonensis]|uniref:hypothetical protein n=1 Tax=Burkholderia ubonensis TaxID=101571 RepID=UPI00105607E4|nr:hypothetical protein [Burkholderia ubonensis]
MMFMFIEIQLHVNEQIALSNVASAWKFRNEGPAWRLAQRRPWRNSPDRIRARDLNDERPRADAGGDCPTRQRTCRGQAKEEQAQAPGACAPIRVAACHRLVMRAAASAARPSVVWSCGLLLL